VYFSNQRLWRLTKAQSFSGSCAGHPIGEFLPFGFRC
jgi:hypothetical protein